MQILLRLSDKEYDMLNEICAQLGAKRPEMLRQFIRDKYQDTIFRRKIGRPSYEDKNPTPTPNLTRKQFIEQNTHNMDVQESIQWSRDNKEKINQYPI